MTKFKLKTPFSKKQIENVIRWDDAEFSCDSINTDNLVGMLFGTKAKTKKEVKQLLINAGFTESKDTMFCDDEFGIDGYDLAPLIGIYDDKLCVTPYMRLYYGVDIDGSSGWHINSDPSDGGPECDISFSIFNQERANTLYKLFRERYDFLQARIKENIKTVEQAKIAQD